MVKMVELHNSSLMNHLILLSFNIETARVIELKFSWSLPFSLEMVSDKKKYHQRSLQRLAAKSEKTDLISKFGVSFTYIFFILKTKLNIFKLSKPRAADSKTNALELL